MQVLWILELYRILKHFPPIVDAEFLPSVHAERDAGYRVTIVFCKTAQNSPSMK